MKMTRKRLLTITFVMVFLLFPALIVTQECPFGPSGTGALAWCDDVSLGLSFWPPVPTLVVLYGYGLNFSYFDEQYFGVILFSLIGTSLVTALIYKILILKEVRKKSK